MQKQRIDSVTKIIGGNSITFRSNLEAKYARYLQFLKEHKHIKAWFYESKTFRFFKPHIKSSKLKGKKYGVRKYLVDFTVIENDGSVVYHETKGYFDSRSLTKLRCMKLYYPDVRIWLVFNGIPKGRTRKSLNRLLRIEEARKFVERVYNVKDDLKKLGIK